MVDEEQRPDAVAGEEEPPLSHDAESEYTTDIEEIRKGLEEKVSRSDLEDIEAWKKDISERLEALSSSLSELKDEDRRLMEQVKELADLMVQKNEELKEEILSKADDTKVRMLKKDMGKMNKKLVSVMEETGFGEIIDVAKIPPNILEIVYDTTLKDISIALWREYGPGAERMITDTLEKIRLETSGSEMFHYDGRFIRTRDVAKNIKRGMISAKQLQDTYEALVRALVEFIPAYKAKNFKAMIKLKSQEYTVDKTTHLLESVSMMEARLSEIDRMLSSAVSGLSAQAARMNSLENTLREDMERRLLEEVTRRDSVISVLERSLEKFKEEYEMSVSDMEKRLAEKEERLRALEERLMSLESRLPGPEVPDKAVETDKNVEIDISSLGDEERFVVSAIPPEGVSYSRLKKSVGALISTPLDDILASLVEKGVVREEKKGRARKFFPAVEEVESAEPEKDKGENSEGPSEEDISRILDSIPERGCTMNRLKKALGKSMEGERVEEVVNLLVQKDVLVKTTRGRYTIYVKKEKGGEKDA